MSPLAAQAHRGARLERHERAALERDGYVLRRSVLTGDDLAAAQGACEAMVERLLARDPGTPKIPAGSYCFQIDPHHVTMVKWEPGALDVVQGVEPFAHFDPDLRELAHDPRFVDPMRDLLGVDDVELFTEKLNVKRARVGGPIVLHQDYPYWVENSQNAAEIATAILFLDDATRENGCLEVLPGSHTDGVRAGGGKDGFGGLEMDPLAIPDEAFVALEVPAGSIAWFGSLLVHRSAPNPTSEDRRTLLYSYQPAGRPRSVDWLANALDRRR